jgi:hypothetical protein
MVSLNNNWPIGLSMMSGSNEPIKRSLISIRLPKETSEDNLLIGKLFWVPVFAGNWDLFIPFNITLGE